MSIAMFIANKLFYLSVVIEPNQPIRRKQEQFLNSKTGRIDEIKSTASMFERIKDIADLETKAFASVMFLTGARRGEIIRKLRPYQIKFTESDGVKYIHFINIATEKKRTPGMHPRTIPVLYDENKGFISFIGAFIKWKHLDEDDLMFTLSERTYLRRIDNALGINIHRLRHIRNTLLVREKGFTESHLMRWNNWSNTNPAKEYVHLVVKDLERQLV